MFRLKASPAPPAFDESVFLIVLQLNNPSLLHEASLMDGKWVESRSGRRFDVEDPGSRRIFASCPKNGVDDVDDYILFRWHGLITQARDDIAQLVVYETGKPMAEALGEVDYALGFAWWFAGEAERVRGSIAIPSAPGRRTFVIKQPIGVSVALVPWNFSVAMITRKVAAALAAGCSMIVKPSPETPLSVLALADLALQAGVPAGVLNVITTDNDMTPGVSEALCKHHLVRKVTFTGSTAIGRLIAKHCSEGLKKVTLELGGNCPFIVFDDADLDQALAALMILKWRTAGQACTHANRVYVQNGVYDKFAAMLVEATRKIKVGHGAEPGTTMGALTTGRGINKLQGHVADAVAKGGKVLHGGKTRRFLGHFWVYTALKQRKRSRNWQTKLANETSMGLASYFFTKDSSRTWRMLEKLEAGMIGMNTGNSSAAESPFGGIKESGYGKEAGKDVAIEEYLISKTGTLTVEPVSKL
ncbi:hypothetical protein HZ326_19462 [Fusarium oxysporum f. sp. albedinis]|nr:hypothetical protein HZ326_19462 [Fusarium oxysporum f. sp. albedinis]